MKSIIPTSIIPFTRYPYTGEQASCNLCGSRNNSVLCTFDRRWKYLTTVVCNDCGLIRTEPMPTEEELERYYKSSYRLEYQFSIKGPPKFHITRSFREAEQRADLLSDFLTPGARVLDFGCGSGEFLSIAAQRGCDVQGVEIDDSYADFARKNYGLTIHNLSWDSLDFERGYFDVITTHHVLEHLRRPVDAIQALEECLKPNGVMYISVPNMTPNHKPSFERFHFAHIHGFTPHTLELSAQACGLAPLSITASNSTTRVFQKASAPSAQTGGPALKDRSRAEALLAGYPESSLKSYVLGGGYAAHLGRQVTKYFRDTFHAKRQN